MAGPSGSAHDASCRGSSVNVLQQLDRRPRTDPVEPIQPISQRASRRRWAARLRETSTPHPHCCNPCRDAKARCSGEFPCQRCFRNCLNCRMQAPGRRRGKGKPRCRPVVEAPAAGEVSFVEQALQRSDYEAKARQLLEAFQQLHSQGKVDRERAVSVLRSWHYASLLADQDVTWGAGPAIADALRLTEAELLGGKGGEGGEKEAATGGAADNDALPSLDAPDDVREAWLARVSPGWRRAPEDDDEEEREEEHDEHDGRKEDEAGAESGADGDGAEPTAPATASGPSPPPPAANDDDDHGGSDEHPTPTAGSRGGGGGSRSRSRSSPRLTPAQRAAVPCYRVLDGTDSPGLLALIPTRVDGAAGGGGTSTSTSGGSGSVAGAVGGSKPHYPCCATNAAWDRAYYSAARIRRATRRHKAAPVLLVAALVGPDDRELWMGDYVAAVFSAKPAKSTNVLKLFNRKGNIRLYIAEFTPVTLEDYHGFVLRLERLPATRHLSDRPTEENEVTKKPRRRRPLWPSVYRPGLYDDPSGESDDEVENGDGADGGAGRRPQCEQQQQQPAVEKEGKKREDGGAAPSGQGIDLLPGLASMLMPPPRSPIDISPPAAAPVPSSPVGPLVLDAATIKRLEALAITAAGAALFRIKLRDELGQEEGLRTAAARTTEPQRVATAKGGARGAERCGNSSHARAGGAPPPLPPMPMPPLMSQQPPQSVLVPAFARAAAAATGVGRVGAGGVVNAGFFLPSSGSGGSGGLGGSAPMFMLGGGGFPHHHSIHHHHPPPPPHIPPGPPSLPGEGPHGSISNLLQQGGQSMSLGQHQQHKHQHQPRLPPAGLTLSGLPNAGGGASSGSAAAAAALFYSNPCRGHAQQQPPLPRPPPQQPGAAKPADPSVRLASLVDSFDARRPGRGPHQPHLGAFARWPSAAAPTSHHLHDSRPPLSVAPPPMLAPPPSIQQALGPMRRQEEGSSGAARGSGGGGGRDGGILG